MRRAESAIVVGQMAVDARRAREAVIAGPVAGGALLRGVRPDERESGGGVIESGARPIGGGVAAGAILREIGGFMRRVGGAVVIGLVTSPAGGVTEVIVAADVALRALRGGMRSRKSEPGGRVIEGGARPVECRRPVAHGAILRESGGFVRRVIGAVVVGQMAVDARRAVEGVVVVGVAGVAGLGGMQAD